MQAHIASIFYDEVQFNEQTDRTTVGGGEGGAIKLSEIALRLFWKLAISQIFNHQK